MEMIIIDKKKLENYIKWIDPREIGATGDLMIGMALGLSYLTLLLDDSKPISEVIKPLLVSCWDEVVENSSIHLDDEYLRGQYLKQEREQYIQSILKNLNND